jgi:HK97 family phage prohead protease
MLTEVDTQGRTPPETKNYHLAFPLKNVRVQREEGKTPVLRAQAVVYDSPSDAGGLAWFEEVVKPGFFTKTLAESDVRALRDHVSWMILGRRKPGRGTPQTLRLEDNKEGLFFEVDLPDTSYARDMTVSVDRGDIDQCSFWFDIIKERMTDRDGKKPLRELLEGKLNDVSVVTFPWYEDTHAEIDMRARFDALVEQARAGRLNTRDRSLLEYISQRLRDVSTDEPGLESHSDGKGDGGESVDGKSVAFAMRELNLL